MALLLCRSRDLRLPPGRPALAALALATLSACAAPPLQPPAPSVPLAAAFSNAEASTTAAAPVPDDAGWSGFGDPTLAALVEQALSANQDVAMALQRVGQARAGADAQGSRLWPTVGVQAAASRSHSGVPEPVKQGLPDT
ncbi:MAG TPA: TolC family protein, partial [Methylibium sp.]|nr:TolC family protein [Methylibium sp.]